MGEGSREGKVRRGNEGKEEEGGGRTWKEGDGGERMENEGEGQGIMKKDRELQRTGKDRKGEGTRGRREREGEG